MLLLLALLCSLQWVALRWLLPYSVVGLECCHLFAVVAQVLHAVHVLSTSHKWNKAQSLGSSVRALAQWQPQLAM